MRFLVQVIRPNKYIRAPNIFEFSCILRVSEHVQIRSAYSQYIQTDSFRVFRNMHSEIPFKDLPYSACFMYTYRFIPHIVSIRTDSFLIF
jgi:hypothetical protein